LGNNFVDWTFGDGTPVSISKLAEFLIYLSDIFRPPAESILDKFINQRANIRVYNSSRQFAENDVIFYVKEEVVMHSARFFNVAKIKTLAVDELRWCSKLGQGLLVSHEVNDLRGELYGEPSLMLTTNENVTTL